jgi:AAA family ATP:ADP antiporter
MVDKAKNVPTITKIFRIFTVIKTEELTTALLLTLNGFLLMAAYYLVKPVREGLILAGTGPEFRAYISAATVVFLIFVVKIFSRIASRFPRHRLIAWVTGFFISNLVLFYIWYMSSGGKIAALGTVFFIWIGIFNVMIIAQFWAFANDLYTQEAGQRIFVLVAFGVTFGAFAGSKAADWLIEPIGPSSLMLVCGAILVISILLTWIIHNREEGPKGISETFSDDPARQINKEAPLKKGGGFRLVFKKRYLLYIALFVLLLNFINTNGEYILSRVIDQRAAEAIQMETAGGMTEEAFIGDFYAGFYSYVNFFAWFIQLFLVSRIFKWVGVRGALFFLPLISLGGYIAISTGAALIIVKWAKILENSTDYSLMNTTRHSLFLVTSREEKYKAKAAIDTFFHRAGDVMSALMVFLGTTFFMWKSESFAGFNIFLISVWITISVLIWRKHKKLSQT